MQTTKSIELMEMAGFTNSGSATTKSNDEEILAHFGKRQQLRVSTL